MSGLSFQIQKVIVAVGGGYFGGKMVRLYEWIKEIVVNYEW